MRKLIPLFISLFFINSCKVENTKDTKLLSTLEDAVNMDNYNIYRSNVLYYRMIEDLQSIAPLTNDSLRQVAIKINEINDELNNNIFRIIRNGFIAKLEGIKDMASADTMTLSSILNKNDKEITKHFYNENFIDQLKEMKLLQKELNDLNPQCMGLLSSIDDLWVVDDFTAQEFIIKLTLTRNRLNKKINCLYNKLYSNNW